MKSKIKGNKLGTNILNNEENINLIKTKSDAKGEIIKRELNKYKIIMKYIDLFVATLTIITAIISQIENRHYTKINRNKRILLVKLAQCMYEGKKIKNHELEIIEGEEMICEKKNFNPLEYDNEFNITNFLDLIDFKNENTNTIPLNFTIDSYCEILRSLILIFTLISISGTIISKKIEHIREYGYIQQKDISFFKTKIFLFMIGECLLISLIQYPKITKVFFYEEFGHYAIYPLSTFLSTISLLRVIFVLKYLKNLTRFTDSKSEIICEEYACKANGGFAFKAFQKENPFIVLFSIFLLSCVCFGYAMQNFEILYWEHHSIESPNYQSWEYIWNSFWFVFVTMTTVGYGDFFPKTQVGRVITIFCSLVGCYFVSSMMVFMTNKTAKNEKEEKSFKLIIRLQYRKIVRDYQSKLIFHAIEFFILFNKRNLESARGFQEDEVEMSNIEKQLNYLKKKMNRRIKVINDKKKIILNCDMNKEKDLLFDVYERIANDIKNIKFELNFLETLNISMKKFTNFQLKCLENVKKNIVSTKFFYDLVLNNKEIFKPFQNLNLPLDENELNFGQKNEELIEKCNTSINNNNEINNNNFINNIPQISEVNESEEEDKEISNVQVNQNKIIEQFKFLFDNNEENKVPRTKTKLLYKEAFDKVEMRRAEREINPNKTKLMQKYISENNVSKYNDSINPNKNNKKNNNSDNSNSNLSSIYEHKSHLEKSSSRSSFKSSFRSDNSRSQSLEKNKQ